MFGYSFGIRVIIPWNYKITIERSFLSQYLKIFNSTSRVLNVLNPKLKDVSHSHFFFILLYDIVMLMTLGSF